LSQLVKPILVFGLIAGGIGFYVSHQLKPWGFRTLSTTLFNIARTRSTAGLEAGIFNDLGEITLYAEEIRQSDGTLRGVLIEDRQKPDQRRIIVAKSGDIQSNAEEKTIIFNLQDGEIHELNEGKYVLTRYVTNRLVMSSDALSGSEESAKARRTRELSWRELVAEKASLKNELRSPDLLLERLKAAQTEELLKDSLPAAMETLPEDISLTPESITAELKDRLRKVDFEMHNRFSLPAAALLLALIGMPLGIQSPRSQRTWGAGLSALIGLLVFLGYFALFSLAKTLAEEGTIAPFSAAWMPNIIILSIALYLLRKMSTEQWQTISEGIERALLSLKRLLVPRRVLAR
ncbi:LptF/LptG family permease, partial [bacterium]|nr:LptF/LptG family permease [bacterium]